MKQASAFVRLTRPKQWLKNVLVAVSPLMAGELFDFRTFLDTFFGIVVFILASAAVYVFNDIYDIEADREHPTKRDRPLASGQVSIRSAWILTSVLSSSALLLPVLFSKFAFASVIVIYLVLQVAYCVWLKHTPLIDITLISSGFLLRAIAGGLVSGVGVSIWFLLVVGFGSFYIAAGKRYSELLKLDESHRSVNARRVLSDYSLDYLRLILGVSVTAVIVFYSLWAAQLNNDSQFAWPLISIVPIALAIFRYQYEVDRGRAESPEDVVTGDKLFVLFSGIWFLIVFIGLYLSPLVGA